MQLTELVQNHKKNKDTVTNPPLLDDPIES